MQAQRFPPYLNYNEPSPKDLALALDYLYNFWNLHDSGSAMWASVNAINATITTETVTTLTATTGLFGDGTVAAPGIAFSSDTDVGWYRVGANNPALSAGNTKVIDAKSTGVAILGTTTNDNAASGFIGETITSADIGATNLTNNVLTDLTSINLTAGDWLLYGQFFFHNTTSVLTSAIGAVTTTSGNSFTGATQGVTRMDTVPTPTTSIDCGVNVIQRVSISATTTYYLKAYVTYTAGQGQAGGKLFGVRIR